MKSDVMHHSSNFEAWKHFNCTYSEFAVESRNIRLELCTNRFQPFGQLEKQYLCWPVKITPHNLPFSTYIKEPFMFLMVIIPGSQNPKQRLNVYLQPLIIELNQLWTVEVQIYDVSKK